MLLTLPPELHLLILTHLPFPSKTHLSLTCTYFHALIPPMTHAELLAAESTEFAISRDLYACRYCLRLRHSSEFGDRMLHKRRGRRGKSAGRRFCVECGLRPRGGGEARYGPGAMVVRGGVVFVVCKACGVFGEVGNGGGEICKVCFGIPEKDASKRKVATCRG
ncbi:hypothetical protein BJX68DRAFT_38831 [Aspergillus pseudodeflectus]|uniref:F-box domain-containing protein n=1 Tax=Aspergillus pseudodeflectus TaxID=176178 RepID=A0ABR4KP65_9EURO